MTIRVAAIEVSHWHALYDAAYLRQIHQMPDVQLAGLQDPDPNVAAWTAAQLGGGVAVFTDYREMLRAVKPDFVIALGRHSAMAEVGHHLLDEGLPFLMEKPMGFDAREVLALAEKTRAKGGFAAVPMPQRNSAFVRKARGMIDEGRFGPLSHIYMRMNRFSSARYVAWNSAWMLDPSQSNGGALRNLGAHGFDAFLHLTGEDAEITGAQISRRALGTSVDDYASVLIRSKSGVLGTLEVGNAYPRRTAEGGPYKGPSRDKFLDGADGEWKVSGRDALLMSKDGALRLVTSDDEETAPSTPTTNPSYEVIAEALRRWKSGDRPEVDVYDCYRAVKLIDEAYGVAELHG